MGRRHWFSSRAEVHLLFIRLLVVTTLLLGVYYLSWRWAFSINWASWWYALPLVLAETYTFVDTVLFGLTMWRMRTRDAPPPLGREATVDVFVTTYSEPVELVRETLRAAVSIMYAHRTYLLDDGERPAMADVAGEEGCDYITRSAAWAGKGRHAKAGNINNALEQTSGEFILILDADQIPDPDIMGRTLGYFADPKVAFVQTPQLFYNVPKGDPFGSQARLFYGPIQQGKDGWNAAFFCGSNAILRREALIQLGIIGYVQALEGELRGALATAVSVLGAAARQARRGGDQRAAAVLTDLREAAVQARRDWEHGVPAQDVTAAFRAEVERESQRIVEEDVASIRSDLAAIGAVLATQEGETEGGFDETTAVAALSAREWSPLGALDVVRRILATIDVTRAHEALPVMPVATLSVTEDMATAMLLHALGWKSVYHHQVLARGLAPEDLRSALGQRLRWAQGTLQVFLRQNPFRVPGLSFGQRLMYLATMWSYLSGFSAVVFLAGPVIFLCFGVSPVQAWSFTFFLHLLPYLAATQVLFLLVGWHKSTWRGQQYSLALFPIWIQAMWTATLNVVLRRPLGFLVTPKDRSGAVERDWRLIKWQLLAICLLVVGIVFGIVRALLPGHQDELVAIGVNIGWAIYDLVVLSVVLEAFFYNPVRRGGAVNPMRL